MKQKFLLSILCSAIIGILASCDARVSTYVESVIDGDTFILASKEHVRLLGIDAPELGSPGADISRAYLTKLILGKNIRLERDTEDKDKYGRLLRYVYVDNLFVNAEMIARGYAITYFYAPNERYKNEFLSLEKEAEELQSGLWGIKGIFQPREIAIGQNEEIIPWQRADKYYGKIKTVEGTIVATHNTGKVCFLNFHKDWKRHFTAVIFASDFDKFPSPPEKLYLNKRVQIKGLIKEYRGKPEIIVKSHSQIKILE